MVDRHGGNGIRFSYEERQAKTECCSDSMSEDDRMTLNCELDWPSSDVPGCSMYDEMRNEIFARYGRAFKTPKWQETFKKTDWYKIRSDFSNDWLSEVAKKNIELLVQKKANKVACMD